MRGRPVFLVCLFILVLRGIWLVFFFSGEESLGFPGNKSPAGEIVLRGEIYRIEETDKTKLLYLKHNSIFQGKDSFPTSNCIVYDSKKQNYQIGNIVKVEGEAKIFENAPNPGNFDQKLYYQKDGLLFSCFAKKISVERKTINQAAQFFYQFRRKWSDMLVHELGEKHGGTLSAMLIGEKKTMDAGEKEIYQKSGIGHLLAVSGLHVSFVGLSFYELLRRVGTPFFAAGAAGIGVLFFLWDADRIWSVCYEGGHHAGVSYRSVAWRKGIRFSNGNRICSRVDRIDKASLSSGRRFSFILHFSDRDLCGRQHAQRIFSGCRFSVPKSLDGGSSPDRLVSHYVVFLL